MKVPYDLREITALITKWCDEVYPTRTRDHMITKLKEEFDELADRPLDAWEMADIMIILLDLCDHLGFDIAKIIHHKMDINAGRTWSITESGILKHVEITGHPAVGVSDPVASGQHDQAADAGPTPIQRRYVVAGNSLAHGDYRPQSVAVDYILRPDSRLV